MQITSVYRQSTLLSSFILQSFVAFGLKNRTYTTWRGLKCANQAPDSSNHTIGTQGPSVFNFKPTSIADHCYRMDYRRIHNLLHESLLLESSLLSLTVHGDGNTLGTSGLGGTEGPLLADTARILAAQTGKGVSREPVGSREIVIVAWVDGARERTSRVPGARIVVVSRIVGPWEVSRVGITLVPRADGSRIVGSWEDGAGEASRVSISLIPVVSRIDGRSWVGRARVLGANVRESGARWPVGS